MPDSTHLGSNCYCRCNNGTFWPLESGKTRRLFPNSCRARDARCNWYDYYHQTILSSHRYAFASRKHLEVATVPSFASINPYAGAISLATLTLWWYNQNPSEICKGHSSTNVGNDHHHRYVPIFRDRPS